MTKRIIKTDQAPAAVGAYSQAVENKGMLFVSGQLPIAPEKGDIISQDPGEQTAQVLKNIKAVLNEADYSLADVVKTEVFISDMDNFAQINEVYADYFQENEPARFCVEAAALPKDVMVEIAAVAIK